jgi:hypothetical protein
MGDMLQCCVCEDWFHEVHLGLTSPEQVRTTHPFMYRFHAVSFM